ncbi:Calycin-like [Parasponia andersonii]|uniref:Calycin-like n=1 Tax=Parasponia andersonii TaxID=3476 RepID=A0A2P5ARQ1_PARAD|nr:Calycin-like [Parasponia andersonii]
MDGSASGEPPLHPAIAPLSFLLGKWRGQGQGGFPTVNAFSFGEELHFSHSGKKGTYNAEEKVIKLQSEFVGNASKVREITRVFELKDGELSYVVQMATNLTTLEPHLKALLKKL